MSTPFGSVLWPLRRPPLELLGIAAHHLHDVVDAARNAPLKVVGAKPRQDGVLDDETRDGVGQRAFQPVADLDAHLALVRRDDQQRPVVRALLPDAPVAAELIAVVFDRGILQRAQGHDDDLVAALGLHRRELVGQRLPRRRVENVGFIDDTAGELREGQRVRQRGERRATATNPMTARGGQKRIGRSP